MDDLPDPNDVPEYLFSIPEEEPNPELLKLLPQKSTLEQFVDVGIYFVAVFQVHILPLSSFFIRSQIICFFACFLLPERTEESESPQEDKEKPPKDEQKKKTPEKKPKETKKNK